MTEKPEWDSRPHGAHWFGPWQSANKVDQHPQSFSLSLLLCFCYQYSLKYGHKMYQGWLLLGCMYIFLSICMYVCMTVKVMLDKLRHILKHNRILTHVPSLTKPNAKKAA